MTDIEKSQRAYDLGLKLDKYVTLYGLDNFQRIAIAVDAYVKIKKNNALEHRPEIQKRYTEETGKKWEYKEWMGDSAIDYIKWLENIASDLIQEQCKKDIH